jgi:hypothetical protein
MIIHYGRKKRTVRYYLLFPIISSYCFNPSWSLKVRTATVFNFLRILDKPRLIGDTVTLLRSLMKIPTLVIALWLVFLPLTVLGNEILLAYYLFDGDTTDSTSQNGPLIVNNTQFIDNTLYLNGLYDFGPKVNGGYTAKTTVINNFSYNNFSISVDFYSLGQTPENLSNDAPNGTINIIAGGPSYRWLSLRYSFDAVPTAHLQLTLNNQDYIHTFEQIIFEPDKWHNVMVSVDLEQKKIFTLFDGTPLEEIELDPSFTLNTDTDSEKVFTFTNYSNTNVFYGYIDNFKVYGQSLSISEMEAIYSAAHTLTVTKTGEGVVSGEGIDCGTDCDQEYFPRTQVTLTATPAANYTFTQWEEACSGTEPTCQVMINQAPTVNAVFTAFPMLTITKTGEGVVSGEGIDCGTDCDQEYSPGTQVTLTATPAANYTFIQWEGACSGTEPTCQVTINQAQTVSAIFAVPSVPPISSSPPIPSTQPLPATMKLITIGFGGNGHGHVTTNPTGIDCDSNHNQVKCSYLFNTATWVNLTATPAADSKFIRWSGNRSDCEDGELFMTDPTGCIAYFELLHFPLTVITTGHGQVKSDPVGIDCNECAHEFDNGTKVTLTAISENGWQFKEWKGDCDENGQVVVANNKKCEAVFTQRVCKVAKPISPHVPVINEISPQATDSEPAWIELHNPLEQEVEVCDLVLVINDVYRYVLPDELAPMPPKSYIVVKLDNLAGQADSYDFKDNKVVLHTSPDLKNAMIAHSGQVAIYRKNSLGPEKIVDFVSWGKPGSPASLTPERNEIWKKRWFVKQINTFGDYDESMLAQAKDFTIGRQPNSSDQSLSNWVAFYGDERTPGADNFSDGTINLFIPLDGAVIRSEDIIIAWTSTGPYQLQIASDDSFSNVIYDVTSSEETEKQTYYKPNQPLPEGTYYYRVCEQSCVGDFINKRTVISKMMEECGSYKVLDNMQYRRQRKDTKLLCLDMCPSHLDNTTEKHWDNIHPINSITGEYLDDLNLNTIPNGGEHGSNNCVRASIAMMVSFYGKKLSQDRIAYYIQEEGDGVGNGIPEEDLAHEVPMNPNEETDTLAWALGVEDKDTDLYTPPDEHPPSFDNLKTWLDAGRPIMTRIEGHMRTMNGYNECDGQQWVHILDPWTGPRWETYESWCSSAEQTWVGPTQAPNAREDEPEIWIDSDGDGIMDFDEQVRFHTGRFDKDSDNDGVNDKEDIYEYVFKEDNTYHKRNADLNFEIDGVNDTDGVRKEKDPDNDDDTFNDGCEDKNHNGIYEPDLGETNNFSSDTGTPCPEKPIHAMIIFDRSGSMASPYSGPSKYDRAVAATKFFLDTWEASLFEPSRLFNPSLPHHVPAATKIGLVYYDHKASFDSRTKLDFLTPEKVNSIKASFSDNLPRGATSIGGGILTAMESEGFDLDGTSADNQHRVIIVFTDGKENNSPLISDVIPTLMDGKVDGYVLGIGNDSQIDKNKLDDLADILNNSPANFAKNLNNNQMEKFYLQILADIQGMQFSHDPMETIEIGQTKTHTVIVNPGAEQAIFAVVWNETEGRIEFTLKDPTGQAVIADTTKADMTYQVATKISPVPGLWTLILTASANNLSLPSTLSYSVMALEKNPSVSAYFEVQGVHFLTGDSLRLEANLSREKQVLTGAQVVVEIEQPAIGSGTFTSQTQVQVSDNLPILEKEAPVSALEKKYLAMTEQGMKVPTTMTTMRLNDQGQDGDEIPGDGKYTGIFKQTQYDGIYAFHFIASAVQDNISVLNREKVVTVDIKPEIWSKASSINLIEREYRATSNQTHLKLVIIPQDRFGNLIGSGNADLLKISAGQVQVLKIVDKLDGSYEIEIIIPGDYQNEFNLQPTFHRLKLGQRFAETDTTVIIEDGSSLEQPAIFPGTVSDQSGTPIAAATLKIGNEAFTTDANGHWQFDNSILTFGTLYDVQGNPLANAIIQLGDQMLTTDVEGHWGLTQPPVVENDSQNFSAIDLFSSLPLPTPTCYASGLVNWVCNANGQQLTDLIVGSNGMIASGRLVGTLTNQGWVSNLILEPHSQLTGGIVTGYINNHGEMADFEFRGAAIVGGMLAGEISNTSQVGGYFRDVQLAANTHLSGGRLVGNISGDAQAPALLEHLEIQTGSHLEYVIIGDEVKLAVTGITLGEGVQFNHPNDDPRLVPQRFSQPVFCDTEMPSLGGSAINAKGQVIETQCQCAGGVSVNGSSFESTTQVWSTDTVEIRGTVCVAPEQLGQLADLVVYFDHQPSDAAEEPQHYMLDAEGEVLPWDSDPAHLVAFQQTLLTAVQEVLLYQGQLAMTGKLNLFFGYRLMGGTLISNSQAIEIMVMAK